MTWILLTLVSSAPPAVDFANGSFTEAARGFDAEWASHPNVQTARNRGRAHLLEGNLARAVVAFRQAEQLAPWDAEVRADLATVREMAGTTSPPYSFRERFGPFDVWMIAMTSSVFVLVGTVVFWMTQQKKWLVLTALGVFGWCSLAFVMPRADREPFAVVSGERVVLRAGNSDFYEMRSLAPLPIGTELTVLGQRGGWLRVRSESGESGWIPESSVIFGDR